MSLGLALPVLSLAGCYAAAVGAALGISAASGSSGGGKNSAPVVGRIDAAGRTSPAAITFQLRDTESNPVDVSILHWKSGADKRSVLLVEGEQSLLRLPTSPRGETHTRHWDFASQLGGEGFHEGIQLEVAIVGEPPPAPVAIAVGNDAPEIGSAIEPPPNEPLAGNVGIGFTVFDTSGDVVSIEVQYAHGGDEEWQAARPALTPDGDETPRFAIVGVEASRERPGAPVRFFWDAVRDLGNVKAEVKLRARAFDGDAFGPWVESRPFALDNNDDPQVQIVDIADSPDRSFEIPIRFLVRDEEEHPVSVVLQWALENEEFLDLGVSLESPSSADLAFLDDLLSAREEDLRREFRILTEAPRRFRGSIDSQEGLRLLPDQVRITSLVRQGLVFRAPTLDGPRPLPERIPFSEDPTLFLLGQRIRFCSRFAAGGVECEGWLRVEAFDPRSSTVTLSEPFPGTPGPLTAYEVEARTGLTALASSREGTLHSFVWDSLPDIQAADVPLDSRVRIRAIAFDSQGSQPSESVFALEASPITAGQTLSTHARDNFPLAVAAGDFNRDGLVDLAVVNEKTDTVDIFNLEASSGSYLGTPDRIINTGTDSRPTALVVEDLTGDGTDDILVSSGRNGTATLHAGDEAFAPVWTLSTAEQPTALALGDVTGDARRDIVIINSGSGTAGVYPGEDADVGPCGRFPCSPRHLLIAESGSRAIAIADFDHDRDGRNDLVLVNEGVGTAGVYLQDGMGALGIPGETEGVFQPSYSLKTGSRPYSIGAGDLDGDGRADAVIADKFSDSASVYFQREGVLGDERWPHQTLRPGVKPEAVAVGDLNGDGRRDIVLANSSSDKLSLFLGKIAGRFAQEPDQTLRTDVSPAALWVGDVTVDGQDDVVVVNKTAGTLNLFIQEFPGAVSAGSKQALANEGKPRDVALGDLNGDGRNDVITLNSGAGADVFLQAPSGRLPPRASHGLERGRTALSVAIADLNGDGRNDITMSSSNGDSARVDVYLQDRNGRLPSAANVVLEAGSSPGAIAAGDLDGDGTLDVAVVSADPASSGIAVFFGRETKGPGESPITSLSTPIVPTWLGAGDFNEDGLCDLAVAGPSASPALVLYYQRRPGGFASSDVRPLDADVAPNSVASGDLNGDGRKDLAFTAFNFSNVLCFLQEPSGQMPSRPNLRLETDGLMGQRSLCIVGDLDGDGTDDVIANTSQGVLYLFHQRPERSLSVEPSGFLSLRDFAGPHSGAIGDVSGDGRNDLVITSFETKETGVFLAR